MLRKDVPAGDGWLFEMKYDGYRCEVAVAGNQVRLYTRNGHDWSRQFGAVAPAFAKLTKGSALIDGELCAIDEDGRSNFTLLKNGLDGSRYWGNARWLGWLARPPRLASFHGWSQPQSHSFCHRCG